MLKGEPFGRLFKTFERTAFRMETLSVYDVGDEQEEIERFLAGQDMGPEFYKSSDGTWWTPDAAGHGGSKFKVYDETKKSLEWRADADRYGDYIDGKWKGETGKSIPKNTLRGAQ